MKVAIINTVTNGSTGKIMLGIAETAKSNNIDVKTFAKKWDSKAIESGCDYIGTKLENRLHAIMSMVTGVSDIYTVFGTLKLIYELKKWGVDCIHLHNIHGWYISFPLLFHFIKKNNIPVVWTLHDCWSFTGKCPYFSYPKCDKWKNGCGGCPRLPDYPRSYFDSTKLMFHLKKKCFTNLPSLILVTPSKWLANLVKQSFLSDYEVIVINNGIDLDLFKPTYGDFAFKHGLKDKYIVLGVAFEWEKRKGLDVFIWLANNLPDDYRIVLVGTNDSIDKVLSNNIISVHKTNNQSELAEIYSSANVFINPTREDNFPTTNIEALACGTPVITFNTGGSAEMLNDNCGCIIQDEDCESLMREIIRICTSNDLSRDNCRNQAEHYNMTNCFKHYIDLYRNTMGGIS